MRYQFHTVGVRRCGTTPTVWNWSHQTQPMMGIGKHACRCRAGEQTDRMERSVNTHSVFENPPRLVDGLFQLPSGPGLEEALAERRVEVQ